MKKYAVIFSCALLAFVCVVAKENCAAAQGKTAGRTKKTPAAEAPLPQVDKEKIRAHVKYLSSDELEGRGTGQRGGDLAADYIGKQFASYGLKPAGDNGTFFQEVPMVGVKTLPETTFKFVEASGKSFEAKNLTDFVTNNENQAETADIDAPIVFVGYGIKAPEYDSDDYKTVDLHGKVAMLFVNEPSSDDPFSEQATCQGAGARPRHVLHYRSNAGADSRRQGEQRGARSGASSLALLNSRANTAWSPARPSRAHSPVGTSTAA